MLLAVDVGGTKVRLALFQTVSASSTFDCIAHYSSREYHSLEHIIRHFLAAHPADIEAAVIGVPGPVQGGTARTTNLPWMISEAELSRLCGLRRTKLVNDVHALAASLPFLTAEQLHIVHSGEPSGGVKAVIAVGTGLGQGFLVSSEKGPLILPSEGGHADFAATNPLETALAAHLRKTFQHVSLERVLSGPGLVNIYEFLRDTGREKEPSFLEKQMKSADPAAIIVDAALKGKNRICRRTVEIFASIMGAHAGNLALNMLATAGVYLGGGIPARIVSLIDKTDCGQRYLHKGRLTDIVEKTPLYIIKDDTVALKGAASLAARLRDQA